MAVQTKMTAAEILELPETMDRVELIDGEIVTMAPAPEPNHQIGAARAYDCRQALAPAGLCFFRRLMSI